MIPSGGVLCDSSSSELTDGYFQIIPEVIVHFNNEYLRYSVQMFIFLWLRWQSLLAKTQCDLLPLSTSITKHANHLDSQGSHDSFIEIEWFSVTWLELSSLTSNVLHRLFHKCEQTDFSAIPVFSSLQIDVFFQHIFTLLDHIPTPLNVTDHSYPLIFIYQVKRLLTWVKFIIIILCYVLCLNYPI